MFWLMSFFCCFFALSSTVMGMEKNKNEKKTNYVKTRRILKKRKVPSEQNIRHIKFDNEDPSPKPKSKSIKFNSRVSFLMTTSSEYGSSTTSDTDANSTLEKSLNNEFEANKYTESKNLENMEGRSINICEGESNFTNSTAPEESSKDIPTVAQQDFESFIKYTESKDVKNMDEKLIEFLRLGVDITTLIEKYRETLRHRRVFIEEFKNRLEYHRDMLCTNPYGNYLENCYLEELVRINYESMIEELSKEYLTYELVEEDPTNKKKFFKKDLFRREVYLQCQDQAVKNVKRRLQDAFYILRHLSKEAIQAK